MVWFFLWHFSWFGFCLVCLAALEIRGNEKREKYEFWLFDKMRVWSFFYLVAQKKNETKEIEEEKVWSLTQLYLGLILLLLIYLYYSILCGLNWVLGSWFVLLPRKLERVMRGKDIPEAQLTLLLYTPSMMSPHHPPPPPPGELIRGGGASWIEFIGLN